jgi:hypothetical protein
MNGAVELYKAAKKHGIKPIIGLEAYYVDDRRSREPKVERNHLTLLAQTGEGLRNLVKLSSAGFLEGLYRGKPGVDLELLARHADGVICLTGCLAARTSQRILQGKPGRMVLEEDPAGRPLPRGSYEHWDWAGLEPILGEWIEAGAAALARVIFNTAVVIETQVAIIDGAMPRPIVERLCERITHHLAALPTASGAPPQVVNGRLGALAPAIGAAELPLYRRYLSRTLADLVG